MISTRPTKSVRYLLIGLIVITAAAIIAYTVWVLSQSYAPESEALLSSLVMISLTLATAFMGLAIAVSRNFSNSIRRAWLLIGLAVLSAAIAEGVWFYFDNYLGIYPFPSIADLFYLLFYPLMMFGIICLPYTPVQRERRVLFGLDTSIIMVLGAMFAWYFILAPMQAHGDGGWAGMIALAYPVADLFILVGLISLIQRDLENLSRVILAFLSASMLFTAIADLLFAVFETYAIPYQMPPLNILWLASYWALLFTAFWQIMYPSSETKTEIFSPLLRHTLVYVAPALGMGLAFISALSLFKFNLRVYGALLGSFILVTLVLIRQYFVLRDNQRLYQKMELQAVTDALTGIYNRHYFNETIQREVKQAERYGTSLSILLVDVDNFKSYNDTHGHLDGDVLLRGIASLLKTKVRESDLLCRFGGDEFVLILPSTNIQQAQVVAEKLKAAVRAQFARDRLGISIGYAYWREGMNSQTLLAEADRSLYLAKPVRA